MEPLTSNPVLYYDCHGHALYPHEYKNPRRHAEFVSVEDYERLQRQVETLSAELAKWTTEALREKDRRNASNLRTALDQFLRDQWTRVPAVPNAEPGSYTRGYKNGIADVLRGVREVFDKHADEPSADHWRREFEVIQALFGKDDNWRELTASQIHDRVSEIMLELTQLRIKVERTAEPLSDTLREAVEEFLVGGWPAAGERSAHRGDVWFDEFVRRVALLRNALARQPSTKAARCARVGCDNDAPFGGECPEHNGSFADETSARRQCGCRTPGCTGCGEFP